MNSTTKPFRSPKESNCTKAEHYNWRTCLRCSLRSSLSCTGQSFNQWLFLHRPHLAPYKKWHVNLRNAFKKTIIWHLSKRTQETKRGDEVTTKQGGPTQVFRHSTQNIKLKRIVKKWLNIFWYAEIQPVRVAAIGPSHLDFLVDVMNSYLDITILNCLFLSVQI